MQVSREAQEAAVAKTKLDVGVAKVRTRKLGRYAPAPLTGYNECPLSDLWVAAFHGQLDEVKLHLAAGLHVDEPLSGHESTALYHAVCGGSLEVTQHLLSVGAAVNYQEDNGMTPLHLAARWGHADIAKLLLEKGGSTHLQSNVVRAGMHCVQSLPS